MKKIIHLIIGLGQGGAECMLHKLLTNMNGDNFENVVVSMTTKGVFGEKLEAFGVPVYTLNMTKGIHLISAFRKYRKIIKKHEPDIVQAWMYHANVFAIVARVGLPKHHVFFNIRQSLDKLSCMKKSTRVAVKANALLSKKAQIVINNSQHSQAQHKAIGFVEHNARYIPNGFDVMKFRPDPVVYQAFRCRYDLPPQSKIVGTIARFHPNKNQAGFLKVAKILKENLSVPGPIYFLMAGRGCDENNVELMSWINRLNLSKQIILLGPVMSSETLPALDVYLSTSWLEGFPNVIGEALACEVPCVASDVGACRELLNGLGYIAAPDDYERMAEYCARTLVNPVASENKMRGAITNNYPINKIVDRYESLYLTFLEEN